MAQTPEERRAAQRAASRRQYQQDMATDPEGRRAYFRAWRAQNRHLVQAYNRKYRAQREALQNQGENHV